MAETDEDDLDLQPSRAGALFRAEMWATNAILGYWRHLLAVVITVLLALLIWGQYQNALRSGQRGTSRDISKVEAGLEDPISVLGQRAAFAPDAMDTEALKKTADELMEVGNESSGAGRTEALLKASELYRIAGMDTERGDALRRASATADGVLFFAAEAALANLELESGEGDNAVGRLRALANEVDGFLAEQATLDLALALEQLDRNDEAAKVYDDFVERFPTSPRVDEVRQLRARVAG